VSLANYLLGVAMGLYAFFSADSHFRGKRSEARAWLAAMLSTFVAALAIVGLIP
jgi:type IV secretory pathway component VirB8